MLLVAAVGGEEILLFALPEAVPLTKPLRNWSLAAWRSLYLTN